MAPETITLDPTVTTTDPIPVEVAPHTEIIQVKSTIKTYIPILTGTPSLGTIRIEWANARQGIVTPTNWAQTIATPTGYLVDDAQNLLVQTAVDRNVEWLFLLEDDTIPPVDVYLKFRQHMEAKLAPIISGLYYIKGSHPPEPLMYRGRGNGAFRDWTPGELVWVDGVPTGCLFIHRSVFHPLWQDSEEYTLPSAGGDVKVRRVFESPRKIVWDGDHANTLLGTSDLSFCERVITSGVLAKTPWPHLATAEHPFVVDTSMRFGHIDRETGSVY